MAEAPAIDAANVERLAALRTWLREPSETVLREALELYSQRVASGGSALRLAALRRGIAPAELARRVQCSRQAVTNIMNGHDGPSRELAARIARELDITTDDFYALLPAKKEQH